MGSIRKRPLPPRRLVPSNPNLLDNWYFIGGGSQQGGGQFPINQRGQTEYTASGYAIDRWTLDRTIVSMTLANGFISLERTIDTGSPLTCQFFENPAEYGGKTLTISVLARGDQSMRLGLVDSAEVGRTENQMFKLIPLKEEYQLYQYTYTAVNGVSAVYVQSMADAVGKHIDLKAIKLEFGNHQTLAYQDEDGSWILNDPPPDFAVELERCQRYQISCNDHTSKYPRFGMGRGFSASVVYVQIPIGTRMRSKPAVITAGNVVLIHPNGTQAVPTSITVDEYNGFLVNVGVRVGSDSPPIQIGQLYELEGYNDISANIILDANL